MRKIALFFILALVASTVNAKTMETILWNDTYTDGVELNSETVADFKAGDVLRVYVTVPADGGNFKIVYKGDSNGWTETMLGTRFTACAWHSLSKRASISTMAGKC